MAVSVIVQVGRAILNIELDNREVTTFRRFDDEKLLCSFVVSAKPLDIRWQSLLRRLRCNANSDPLFCGSRGIDNAED